MLIADDGTPLLTDFGSITTLMVDIPNRQKALDAEEEAASKTSAPYRSPELTQVGNDGIGYRMQLKHYVM